MKSLVLGGGFATRLRPLSCSKPKLLFPIVGRPMIEVVMDWLKEGGVSEIILAVNHLSEKFRLAVGKSTQDLRIFLSVEEEPLGTAGPIRFAESMLRDGGSFIVVNGDIVSNIDLSRMVRNHQERSATATVALVKVREPIAYGSATFSRDGRISKFEEKKSGRSLSGLVNAGAYVFSPDIFDYIPSRGAASLERDVFPKLAERGVLWGWKHSGYWYDIGRISEYVRTNMELLALFTETQKAEVGLKAVEVKLTRPLHVGNGSKFGRLIELGPDCILSERISVGDRSKIRRSIVFEDTTIGEGSVLDGALVGERVRIGRKSRLGRGSIVAGEISIPDGSVIRPGSVILA